MRLFKGTSMAAHDFDTANSLQAICPNMGPPCPGTDPEAMPPPERRHSFAKRWRG